MPRLLDILKSADESTGGFSDIEPGAYALVITNVDVVSSKSYVRIDWDVLSGDHKGNYAKSQYPPSDFISWSDKALGMYKHKLHILADANPNRLHAINDESGKFASLREAEEDNWEALVGCRFWAVVCRRLYTAGPNSKNPGADRTQMRVSAWITQEEFDKGSWRKSLMADKDDRENGGTQQVDMQQEVQVPDSYDAGAVDIYDEDIPF